MTAEVWKDIEGWEGFYQVSNYGNIRSVHRISIKMSPHKKPMRVLLKGKLIKFDRKKSAGYYRVVFWREGEYRTFLVHRLVLQTFQPVANFHILQVNHKDGIKTNNQIDNLEWVTRSENCSHGVSHIRKSGFIAKKSTLNPETVLALYRDTQSNLSAKELMSKYNISMSTVNKIKNKKHWTYILKDTV